MNQKTSSKLIKPICANCHYYCHLVGVGFGIRCSHKSNHNGDGLPNSIPSREHSCSFFKVSSRLN